MNKYPHIATCEAMIEELRNTNSINEKIAILRKPCYIGCWTYSIFAYDPFRQYGVTSENVKKRGPALAAENPDCKIEDGEKNETGFIDFFDSLVDRKITGNQAILWTYLYAQEFGDLVYSIIDKDFKCRIDASLINRAFPKLIREFNVALAKSYKDFKDKVNFEKDDWFVSRKLNGVRCLIVVDAAKKEVEFFSRNGKEYSTLEKIAEEIKEKLSVSVSDISDCLDEEHKFVLDGEVCLIDENGMEDFQGVVSLVRRKNYTVENPMFSCFDVLTFNEFDDAESEVILSERLKRFEKIFQSNVKLNYIQKLPQTSINNVSEFDKLMKEAVDAKWEGLILRKNTEYEGKRSSNMLKAKEFQDAEYVVESVEPGEIQYIDKNGNNVTETMMGKVVIKHKGYDVGVGSGWTIEQRKEFYKNPEKIVGKIITVQYFSESQNKQGGFSLQFPTFKGVIYESTGRDL